MGTYWKLGSLQELSQWPRDGHLSMSGGWLGLYQAWSPLADCMTSDEQSTRSYAWLKTMCGMAGLYMEEFLGIMHSFWQKVVWCLYLGDCNIYEKCDKIIDNAFYVDFDNVLGVPWCWSIPYAQLIWPITWYISYDFTIGCMRPLCFYEAPYTHGILWDRRCVTKCLVWETCYFQVQVICVACSVMELLSAKYEACLKLGVEVAIHARHDDIWAQAKFCYVAQNNIYGELINKWGVKYCVQSMAWAVFDMSRSCMVKMREFRQFYKCLHSGGVCNK